MSSRCPNLDWWLRLPLVPIVFAVGCVLILGLVIVELIILPWLLLYPEYHRHVYDYGDARQQRIVRRWRSYCRRVPFTTRLRRICSCFRSGNRGATRPNRAIGRLHDE
jgi:hypothetical protein